MNAKKLYYGLIGLLVLLGTGTVLSASAANTLLSSHSRTLVSLKAKEKAAVDQQTKLVDDKRDIATYSGLNAIAQTVVPQDKDQAEAVREIVNLASQSGISQLGSITFPPSTLGAAGSSANTGSNLTQVSPVKGIPGVYDLQITITQDSSHEVPYSSFIAFLTKLEQNRRTAQVSSINVQPDQKKPAMIAFNLIIDEFIKP